MILGRVICLSDLGNILAYYLDETTLLYKCKYYLCPGLIDTKCKYYLCPGLINTTCKYYLCPGLINTKCKYYLCPGLINSKCKYYHCPCFINTKCKYYHCPGLINAKCKYYLCPGLINTKCIYTLHNSIFIPAFFICVQGEHRSSQFQLIPYLRVRWEDSPYICRLWWICIYCCITIIAISMTICVAYCCITTISWLAVYILCRWNMLLVFELR